MPLPKYINAPLIATLALATMGTVGVTTASAKRGADDPAGHVRKAHGADDARRASHGADDAAGHTRHGHGADDAPGHH